jgi:hypothetical protein
MALTKRAKETNQKEELIVTAEILAEIRLVAERIGGIENFNYAMDVWEYKGPKERVEDVISPEELAKIFSYDEYGNLFFIKTGKKTGYLKKDYFKTNFVFQDHLFQVAINKIIFCLHNGRWAKKGYKVDHINGISTDNRPDNLRESTSSQNNYNALKPINNTSGVKGVSLFSVASGKVRVTARINCNSSSHRKSMTVEPQFVEATIQILKAWRYEKGLKLHGEFFNAG